MPLKNLAEMNNHLKNLEQEYNTSEENKPKLNDYYKPSEEMKEYELIVVSLIGIGGGYIISKVL